jgi:protocatechuate 3,4-dioxygenase beta subunit
LEGISPPPLPALSGTAAPATTGTLPAGSAPGLSPSRGQTDTALLPPGAAFSGLDGFSDPKHAGLAKPPSQTEQADAFSQQQRRSRTGVDADVAGGESPPEITPTPAPGEALVGGRVLRGTQVIAGAVLSLSGAGRSLRATSDEQGYYQFVPIAAGSYTLALLNPSSPSPSRVIVLETDDRQLDQDFILPEGKALHGTVVDQGTKAGIKLAQVTVVTASNKYLFSLYTQEGGTFKTALLTPGDYILTIEAQGYQKATRSVTIADDYSNDPEQVEITLVAANVIAGKVMDMQGNPIPGAMVGLFTAGASAFNDPLAAVGGVQTDASGNYQISKLPPVESPFRVGVWKDGFVPAYSSTLALPEATYDAVEPIQLFAGVRAVGRITDSKSQPIAGVVVAIPNWDSFVSTGAIGQRFNARLPQVSSRADGSFVLSGLEPCAATLEFSAEGYVSQRTTQPLSPPQTDLGDITLVGELESEEGVISGQVIDELGNTFRGANCTLVCTNCNPPVSRFQVTGELGHFSFKDVPDGLYRLEIATPGLRDGNLYMVINARVAGLRPGQEAVIALLDLGGKVRVQVKDSSGEPVRNFRVKAVSRVEYPRGDPAWPDYVSVDYTTSFERATGEALIRHLAVGKVDLTISVEGLGVAEARGVPVPVDGTGDAGTIVIQGGADMSGRIITEENNQPLPGVVVYAIPPEGASSDHILNRLSVTAITGESGQFILRPLPEGSLRIRAKADELNRVEQVFTGFRVQEGQPNNAGDLPMMLGGILQGAVVDADGNRIAGALVQVPPAQAWSDSQGNYVLRGVAPGSQMLHATDYRVGVSVQIPVEILSGTTRDLLIEFR